MRIGTLATICQNIVSDKVLFQGKNGAGLTHARFVGVFFLRSKSGQMLADYHQPSAAHGGTNPPRLDPPSALTITGLELCHSDCLYHAVPETFTISRRYTGLCSHIDIPSTAIECIPRYTSSVDLSEELRPSALQGQEHPMPHTTLAGVVENE